MHRPLAGYHSDDESVRKRRRLSLSGHATRTLPRPAPAGRRGKKRALLPPLLPPLHNPPVGERIIPSMVGADGLVKPMLESELNALSEAAVQDVGPSTGKSKKNETEKSKSKEKSTKKPATEGSKENPKSTEISESQLQRPGKHGKTKQVDIRRDGHVDSRSRQIRHWQLEADLQPPRL